MKLEITGDDDRAVARPRKLGKNQSGAGLSDVGRDQWQVGAGPCLVNTAARLITKTKKFEHISGILEQLHWLPAKKRIIYKVLLLAYKAVNGQSPEYISELVSFYNPPRSLRSSTQRQLISPRYSTSYAKRAFSVAAPQLWNKLPIHIRQASSLDSFKSQLKSHLFISIDM